MIIGADLSSRKLAFAARGLRRPYLAVVKLPEGNIPPRIYAAYVATSEFLHAALPVCPDSDVREAFIESPLVGRVGGDIQSTIKQCLVSGGVQTALLEWGFTIHMTHPSTWKKTVVGKGNAKKEEVGPAVERLWREAAGIAGDDQDLLDAIGILLHAESIVARAGSPELLRDQLAE